MTLSNLRKTLQPLQPVLHDLKKNSMKKCPSKIASMSWVRLQKLMLHQPFRHLDELLGGLETHSQAYSAFLQSSTVPPSLADDIHRLEAAQRVDREENEVNAFVAALNDCTIYLSLIIRTQEQDQDQGSRNRGGRGGQGPPNLE